MCPGGSGGPVTPPSDLSAGWRMVKTDQLAKYVIRPALQAVGLHSLAAEQLLLGTAAAGDQSADVCPPGARPGVGIFQMEPATHDDIWTAMSGIGLN